MGRGECSGAPPRVKHADTISVRKLPTQPIPPNCPHLVLDFKARWVSDIARTDAVPIFRPRGHGRDRDPLPGKPIQALIRQGFRTGDKSFAGGDQRRSRRRHIIDQDRDAAAEVNSRPRPDRARDIGRALACRDRELRRPVGAAEGLADGQAGGGRDAPGEDLGVVDAAADAASEGAGDGDEGAALAREAGIVDRLAKGASEDEAQVVAQAAPPRELNLLDGFAEEPVVGAQADEALPRETALAAARAPGVVGFVRPDAVAAPRAVFARLIGAPLGFGDAVGEGRDGKAEPGALDGEDEGGRGVARGECGESGVVGLRGRVGVRGWGPGEAHGEECTTPQAPCGCTGLCDRARCDNQSKALRGTTGSKVIEKAYIIEDVEHGWRR